MHAAMRRTAAERNLLLGLLAVQMNFLGHLAQPGSAAPRRIKLSLRKPP
jgi:hypothetical protein